MSFEGNEHGPIKILSQNLPTDADEETWKVLDRTVGPWAQNPTHTVQNTMKQECYPPNRE